MDIKNIKEIMSKGNWKIDPATNLPLAIIDGTEDGNGIIEFEHSNEVNIADANAIILAINNTWLKNINPNAIEPILQALKDIEAWGKSLPPKPVWSEMLIKAKIAIKEATI